MNPEMYNGQVQQQLQQQVHQQVQQQVHHQVVRQQIQPNVPSANPVQEQEEEEEEEEEEYDDEEQEQEEEGEEEEEEEQEGEEQVPVQQEGQKQDEADLADLHYLRCGICKSYFNEPVAVTCGCSFCKDCVRKGIVRLAKKGRPTFRCPKCKVYHPINFSTLVVNTNLMEATKRKMEAELGFGMVCQDCHQRILDCDDMYVCATCTDETCEKLVCGRCGMKKHRQHETKAAEFVSRDERADAVGQVKGFLNSCADMNKELDDLYAGVRDRFRQTISTMNELKDGMNSTIRLMATGNQLRKPTVDRIIEIHNAQLEFFRKISKPAEIFAVHPEVSILEMAGKLMNIEDEKCTDAIGVEAKNVLTEWRRNPLPAPPSDPPTPQAQLQRVQAWVQTQAQQQAMQPQEMQPQAMPSQAMMQQAVMQQAAMQQMQMRRQMVPQQSALQQQAPQRMYRAPVSSMPASDRFIGMEAMPAYSHFPMQPNAINPSMGTQYAPSAQQARPVQVQNVQHHQQQQEHRMQPIDEAAYIQQQQHNMPGTSNANYYHQQ